MASEYFDLTLVKSCVRSFAAASGIGCTMSNAQGTILFESGYGCASCGICRATGRQPEICVEAHNYGMTEAARYGGKYIYFCPMGLTCFVSPIFGAGTIEGKITAGPFLMVDPQDYLRFDGQEQLHLGRDVLARVAQELTRVPTVNTDRVTALSNLLFMAVGFINNVSDANRMLAQQGSVTMQGQITAYVLQLKNENTPSVPYPLETEEAFLSAVRQGDRDRANKLLNELLGYIFFSTGGVFSKIKTMIYDLLVLLCRCAMHAGVDQEKTMESTNRYYLEIHQIQDFDLLCQWITRVVNTTMDSIFDFGDVRHAGIIHQSVQYIHANYAHHLSLEQMARQVYLSPTYFGRIFKQGTGESFSSYLARVRIQHSQELLRYDAIRLTDIAQLVGFEDQSYFTRVFKRLVGTTPRHYREVTRNNIGQNAGNRTKRMPGGVRGEVSPLPTPTVRRSEGASRCNVGQSTP